MRVGDRGKRGLQLLGTPYFYKLKLHSQGRGGVSGLFQHVGGRMVAESAGMPEHSDARNFGQQLLQKGQTFGDQLRTKKAVSADVSSRARQACYEPVADGI